MNTSPRAWRWGLAAVFVLALALRLSAIGWVNAPPTGDGPLFDKLAVHLLNGQGYADRPADGPTAWVTPGYPLFLAAIYAVAGHSYDAVRVVQAILGALTCVLVILLGRQLISPAVGWIAGAACAFHPFLIQAGTLLFTETLFLTLVVAGTWCWARFLERERWSDLWAASALWAWALLTRPMFALFPPLILAWLIVRARGRWSRRLMMQLGVVVATCALAVAPWAARNYAVFGRFVPLATQMGDVLYVSYHPAQGKVLGMRDDNDPIMREATQRYPMPADEVNRSQFLTQATLHSIEWKRVPYLLWLKTATFWSVFDWEIFEGGHYNIGTALLLPWLCLGAWGLWRTHRRTWWVLFVPVMYSFALGLIFYGLPRFRLTVEPLLTIAAAAGLTMVWQQTRHRAWVASALSLWVGLNVVLLQHSAAVKDASRQMLARWGLW